MFNLPDYPTLEYLFPLGILAFVVLFLTFFILSVVFVRMLVEASSLKDKSSHIYEEAKLSLDRAKEQAFSLINDANKEAGKILEDASYLSHEMSDKIDSHLEGIAQEGAEFVRESTDNLLKAHRRALLEASKGNLVSMREVSDEFKKELTGEISEFRKSLESMSIEVRKNLEEDLSKYKADRIKSIDNEIHEIVQRASAEILGKSLNLEDHEEFILRVLEEAKGKGELVSMR